MGQISKENNVQYWSLIGTKYKNRPVDSIVQRIYKSWITHEQVYILDQGRAPSVIVIAPYRGENAQFSHSRNVLQELTSER